MKLTLIVFQLSSCLLLMTGLCSILILCALSFVPVLPSPGPAPGKEEERTGSW